MFTWFLIGALFVTDCVSTVTPTNDEGLLYSDHRWHELVATRDERTAYISIDSIWKGLIFIEILSFLFLGCLNFHLWHASSGHLNMHVFHMQVYTRYHSQRIWSTYYLISYIVYCTLHIEFDKNPRCCFYPA